MDKSLFRKSLIGLAVASALGLSACGGGGGSSSASGGALTSGVITGFGSVFVNGVEYDTSGSDITINGVPATENDLEVGMVVTLRGTASGTTGSALSIQYEDELQGIVQTNNVSGGVGSLQVMGLTIKVDSNTVFESRVASIADLDSIQQGNIVEVSGYRLDDQTIQASLVEVKQAAHNSGDEIEVKGAISNLDNPPNTFQIGALTVDYSGVSSVPTGGLQDTLFVEVKSTQGLDASGNLIASAIELSSNGDAGLDGDEGEEMELSGPIGVGPDTSGFTLNGTPVVIDSNTEFKHGQAADIAEGVQVKVEGAFDANGNLVAKEISFNEASEAELQGTLEAVSAADGTITLMGLTIKVDASTMKKDDSSAAVRYFGLDDLAAGDRVEVSFYKDKTTGELIAVKLKREDAGGSDRVEGIVDSVTPLTVSGIAVDAGTLTLPALTPGATKVKVVGSYDTGTGQFTATSLTVDN